MFLIMDCGLFACLLLVVMFVWFEVFISLCVVRYLRNVVCWMSCVARYVVRVLLLVVRCLFVVALCVNV